MAVATNARTTGGDPWMSGWRRWSSLRARSLSVTLSSLSRSPWGAADHLVLMFRIDQLDPRKIRFTNE
jgi:hypothetical protein